MDSVEDEASRDSNFSSNDSYCTQYEQKINEDKKKTSISVVRKLFNRQLYGRFTKNPRAKTERIYEKIPETCNRLLSDVLPEWDTSSAMQHIYMGFTICGQYLLSYTWTTEEDLQSLPMFSVIYYLCIWRYAPGQRLKMISKQKIFRHYRPQELLDVTFSQWPTDREKVVAYGVNLTHPSDAYITILFLPTLQKCDECSKNKNEDVELMDQTSCLRHSVTIDFMLSITTPYPVQYNPILHLAYPDHIVVNTGHNLHVINVAHILPKPTVDTFSSSGQCFSDSLSVLSGSDLQDECNVTKSVVDAIIQDFSEYDLEGSDCSKPFHELNICCEPLNVTGKNYYTHTNLFYAHTSSYNSNVSNNNNKSSASSKSVVEKTKIAEKAYEFTEDTEKCEKLSSFRKKRLADKKYEFSEDNSENIVPFQLLRQERRFLLRNQTGGRFFVKSPRSPMLSVRVSPGNNCRSPVTVSVNVSPRDNNNTRKINVYSPSHIDSDCSDNDSKLVLRQIHNVPVKLNDYSEKQLSSGGLLIVDGKKLDEKPRWIRKVVKRYCNLDFETASLVSDVQGRDDYLCIDIPTLVYTANNNQIDPVPSRVSDDLIGPHLKVIQKSFDFEQFCQRRAEKLCADSQLKFSHCQDYDIKIQHICPLSGDIICTADLKLGAIPDPQKSQQPLPYTTSCMFVWNMCNDLYRVLESQDSDSSQNRLLAARQRTGSVRCVQLGELPVVWCKKVRYMAHNFEKSLQFLRDSDNYIQISMDKNENGFLNYLDLDENYLDSYHYSSDSDYDENLL